MSNINRHQGDNYGGITKLYYAIHQDIAFQIDWLKDPFSLTQAFIDAYFSYIKFESETAGFQAPRKNTAQGPQWNFTAGFNLHQDRDEIDVQIEKVAFRKLLLIVVTTNGQAYIIGAEEEGVFQVENFSSGSRPAELNGYQYKFEGSLSKKPAKITIN